MNAIDLALGIAGLLLIAAVFWPRRDTRPPSGLLSDPRLNAPRAEVKHGTPVKSLTMAESQRVLQKRDAQNEFERVRRMVGTTPGELANLRGVLAQMEAGEYPDLPYHADEKQTGLPAIFATIARTTPQEPRFQDGPRFGGGGGHPDSTIQPDPHVYDATDHPLFVKAKAKARGKK